MKKIMALCIAAAMLTSYASTAISASATTISGVNDISFSVTDLNKSAETSGDYSYTVLEDGTVEITDYLGSDSEVIIPTEIDGKLVTSINNSIFYTHFSLEKVTIPASVTYIGDHALRNSTTLKNIEVDENNEIYSSVNGALLNKAQTELITYPKANDAAEYTVPDSVTIIDQYAFYLCSNLQQINIPEGVTEIGTHAFESCTGLTSIALPEGITNIVDYTFISCNGLKEVSIPKSVTTIGNNAFGNCINITDVNYAGTEAEWKNIAIGEGNFYLSAAVLHASDSEEKEKSQFVYEVLSDGMLKIKQYVGDGGHVVIPTVVDGKRVTTIGAQAFFDCDTVTSVEIPKTITKIEWDAFYDCENLENVTMTDKVKTIEGGAFQNCISLTDITLPSKLTAIYGFVFAGCESLKEITIPSSVTSIDECAFMDCTGLERVNLPEGLLVVGDNAFFRCESLTDINLPKSLTSIGNFAFERCSSLTSIAIPENVDTIGNGAFYGCNNLVDFSVDENNSYFSYEDGVFFNKEKTTLISVMVPKKGDYVIPDTVKTINIMAFDACDELISVTIPASVIDVPMLLFRNCINLEKIFVDENNANYASVEGILYDKEKKTIIDIPIKYTGEHTIPASATNIENIYLFGRCNGLTKINVDPNNPNYSSLDGVLYNKEQTILLLCPNGFQGECNIPDTLKEIHSTSFYDCPNLTGFNVDPENPYITSIDGVIFTKDKTTILCCPQGREGEYVIPNYVTTLGVGAFYSCKKLTNIEIPEGVLEIPSLAFCGCKSIVSMVVPEGVVFIDDFAFSNCESMTYLDVPKTVTEISPYAFSGYMPGENKGYIQNFEGDFVIFGDGILYTYKGNGGDVVIPDGVKYILEDAFLFYENITSLTIPNSVIKIGNYNFYDCTELKDIYYTGTEEEWNSIEIGEGNSYFLYATIHYNWVIIPPTPDQPLGICGDVNCDDRVNSIDALTILRSITGSDKLTDEEKMFADVNFDGRINTIDSLEILRYCAGYTENTSVNQTLYQSDVVI